MSFRRCVCPLLLWLVVACGDRPGESDAVDSDGDGFAPGPDCNDDDGAIHPDADERCNAVDDDCDGDVDEEAVDAIEIYADADGDGYGGAAEGTACTPGPEQTSVSGDCDDAEAGAHPGGVEICNDGRDDDCDGSADDADDDTVGGESYYADNDGDGFGGGDATIACAPPAGLISDGSDCNNLDAAVHPGVEEICNGLDDDCDPFTLETGIVSVDGVRYVSIQDAIDAARIDATVSLCDGTWFENVTVPKNLVIEGRGADLTVVDGSDFGSVLQVVAEDVDLVVRGVTLQHGAGEYVDMQGNSIEDIAGGAIEAWAAGSLELDACVVADSTAEYGGGVLGPEAGDTILSGTTFRGNAAFSGGGAYVSASSSGNIDIEDCLFTGNTAYGFGGGLNLNQHAVKISSTSTIRNTTFNANVADPSGYGGGLASNLMDLGLEGVTISNNLAQFGGGFFGGFYGANVVADDKTEVFGNETYEGGVGGGIYAGNYPGWRYGHIWGNTASFGGGAVVWETGELRDVLIEENHAVEAGGGACIDGGGLIRDSDVSGNTSDGSGGGLYVTESPSYLPYVKNTIISGNVAKVRGGGAEIEATFRSVESNRGTGKTDNSPDDVAFLYWEEDDPVIYSDFTSLEDFRCDVEDQTCE